MLLRWLLVLLAIAASARAEEPAKPRCNAQHRGELWPANARNGTDPQEMCTLDVWKYRWESVTVSVSQLAKKRKHEKTVAPTTDPKNP